MRTHLIVLCASSDARSPEATNQYTMQLFDKHGRVLRAEQIVGSGSYAMQHGYDLAGRMTAAVYPSSPVRRMNYTINPLGQVTEIRDGAGKILASGAEYAAHGALTKLVLGNGPIEKMTPNARLQPLKIELGSAAVSDEVGSFTFGYSGSTCVAGQTWANNGNVVSQAIKAGASTFTQSYGYDGLNRLTCAKEETAWEQRYGLDVYGNRWVTVNTLPMTSALTATAKSNFNATNNRLITSPAVGIGMARAIATLRHDATAPRPYVASRVVGYLLRNSRTMDSLRHGHRASSSPVWSRAFAVCALLRGKSSGFNPKSASFFHRAASAAGRAVGLTFEKAANVLLGVEIAVVIIVDHDREQAADRVEIHERVNLQRLVLVARLREHRLLA